MNKRIKNVITCASIIFYCCWSINVSAVECNTPVAPIKQGQAAPCDGFIFSNSEEEIAYKATQISGLQKEEISILQERLDNYKSEANDLSKQLATKTSNDEIMRIVYFVAGMGITALAVRTLRP